MEKPNRYTSNKPEELVGYVIIKEHCYGTEVLINDNGIKLKISDIKGSFEHLFESILDLDFIEFHRPGKHCVFLACN